MPDQERDLSSSTESSPVEVESPVPSPVTEPEVWWEVCAVLAIGVFPHLVSAIDMLVSPHQEPRPYWVDAFVLIGTSLCTIYATLFIIHKSGLGWSAFGIMRPRLSDVFIGMAICITIVFFEFFVGWPKDPEPSIHWYAPPRSSLDYFIMGLKFLTSGAAEEFVTRAYLITRLEGLLRSRHEAVLLAALAFASYHIYQGLNATLDILLLGVMFGACFVALRRISPLIIAHALDNIMIELGM